MDDSTMEMLHQQRPQAAIIDDRQHVIYLRHLLNLEEVGQVQQLAGRRALSLQTICIEVMCRHLVAGTYRWNLNILPPALACAVGDGCLVRLEPMKERLNSAVVEQIHQLELRDQYRAGGFSSVLSSAVHSERQPNEPGSIETIGSSLESTTSHRILQSSHRSSSNQRTSEFTPLSSSVNEFWRLSFNDVFNNICNNSTYYSQLLSLVYSKHTQLAWLKNGFSLDFYISQAIALTLKSPRVKEIHSCESLGEVETVTFLNAYLSEYRPDLLALCGNFKYSNLSKLLSRCSQLRRLEVVINNPQRAFWDFHSTVLTHLSLHINISLSLNDLNNKLPNLEKLSLSSPVRGHGTPMPSLHCVFPGATASKLSMLPRLTNLEITGFCVYDALSTPLNNLKSLSLRKCICPYNDLDRHPALSTLNLKVVKNSSGFDGKELRFESVETLELHSQWGEKFHINLNMISASFPKLKSLEIRNDFYVIDQFDSSQNSDVGGSGEWFHNLRQLSLITTAGRPSGGALAIFSAVLPSLTTLFMKRCVSDTDLLARFCPKLENIDFFHALPPVVATPLPSVRRAIFRFTHLEVIAALCDLLPALAMTEIRVSRVSSGFAQACKVLMHRLNKTRNLQMVVMEMW